MRSSPSTPNRRRNGRLRLLVALAGEDHPKVCTGRRLLRWGRVERTGLAEATRGGAVVLDPHARSPLSGADRAAAARGGILVVDCSWNRLAERGGLPHDDREETPRGIRRRLPFLIATNPQHYGRLAELNTAEALGAAVYLLDDVERAGRLLEGFRGGPEFLHVNRTRLERYRACAGPDEVTAAERALFGG